MDAKVDRPLERLSAHLADDLAAVDAMIRARMASEHAPRIPEVTAHLIGAGGKRVRAILTLAAARLCGYGGAHHIRLAATVEFIHTATLLHDDVVDESRARRGRPTANLLWDNKSSVLVGDYLFARSFQLMTETGSLRVLSILSDASATIAEGEVLQLTAAQNLATTEEIYLRVVRGKTAALFAAAAEVGGVIAGAPEAEVAALRTYGDALGIAFQMADDVLRQGVQGITDLITIPGLINLDFADIRTIMRDSGTALMGIGQAAGDRRAGEAARAAISSPLLESSVEGATGILLNITGGPDLGLFEVNDAAEVVANAADQNANIIFGSVIDESMGDHIRVTVVATGFDRKPAPMPRRPLSEDRGESAPRSPGVSAFSTREFEIPAPVTFDVDDDSIDVPSFLKHDD